MSEIPEAGHRRQGVSVANILCDAGRQSHRPHLELFICQETMPKPRVVWACLLTVVQTSVVTGKRCVYLKS